MSVFLIPTPHPGLWRHLPVSYNLKSSLTRAMIIWAVSYFNTQRFTEQILKKIMSPAFRRFTRACRTRSNIDKANEVRRCRNQFYSYVGYHSNIRDSRPRRLIWRLSWTKPACLNRASTCSVCASWPFKLAVPDAYLCHQQHIVRGSLGICTQRGTSSGDMGNVGE